MKFRKGFTRVFSLLLVMVVVVGIAFTTVASAEGKPIEVRSKSIKKTYEIAVAYDNSGSMYGMTSKWYQAKYAMEIFASMLNFADGDKLMIFPMHKVTTGDNAQVERFEVKSVADIDKVHKMFTPAAGGTPFATVTQAYTYLRTSKADVRWLVVLTDGAFSGVSNPQRELEKYARGDIKVRYIPFGGIVLSDTDANDNFYASPSVNNEAELQRELITSCNQIFQRDELKNRLNGQNLKIDITMKKLIVFVQGKGATITSLKDSSGKEIKKISDSGQRSYSEIGTSGSVLPAELKEQKGQVVIFDSCSKGDYTLEYSNAENIQIFYEPDVTMRVSFTNDDGVVADFKDDKIEAGEYTYKVEIIDSETGEDVTNHELMGGKVEINDSVKYNGKEIDLKNGDKVTFEPGKNVDFDISANYLGKYKLSVKDQKEITFGNIEITIPEAKLKVAVDVTQKGNRYILSRHNSWKPIRVTLTMDGNPLSDDQLTAATIDFKAESDGNKLNYRIEKLMGESAVNIYIAQDDNGKYIEPKTGKYDCKVSATAPDIYNEIIQSKTVEEIIKIRLIPPWIWLLILLLAIAFIAFLLGIPVKPSIIYLSDGDVNNDQGPINISGGFQVYQISNLNDIAFSAKAKTKKAWFKNSWVKRLLGIKSMSFIITDISSDVSDLDITEGSTIRNNTPVSWYESDGTFYNGRFYINNNPN